MHNQHSHWFIWQTGAVVSVQPRSYCCVGCGGMQSWSGRVISSKLIWSEGAAASPASLMSDSRKISMKDVLHLLSADTNPIHPPHKVTRCLHTASPRSTLMEIKTRTCCSRSAIIHVCVRCMLREETCFASELQLFLLKRCPQYSGCVIHL